MSADLSFDPRTGASGDWISHTALDDVDAIVDRAAKAVTIIANTAPTDRRRWLFAAADALESNIDELTQIADAETALGSTRLRGEVKRTAGQIRFYAEVAVEGAFLGTIIDEPTSTTPAIGLTNVPLGPVAVFGASNFPFAFSVFGNDTASAIAAGCSAVIKAHPAHPLVSQRVFQLTSAAMISAGAPEGLLSLVFGFDSGVAIVKHPAITALAFTGSQAGGISLWRTANERTKVIPVYAEMGAVNPVLVTSTAATNLANIAKGFVSSFTLGAGQFCTKPGLMLIPRGCDGARLVASALEAASPQPVMLTKGIAESVAGGVAALQAAGATIIAATSPTGIGWSAPAAILTAPIASLGSGSRLLEEVFGAVALVVEYDDLDQAMDAVDTLQGALAASVFIGEDDADGRRVLTHLHRKVGRVIVNEWPTGVAVGWAQQHGGPWPATSNAGTTSVGAAALGRFVRPVAFQGVPDSLNPPPLQATNPWGVPRRVNGVLRPGRSA